ncbi:dTDP-Rha--alpha-D-GlcNAc-pyrophosphate polyprenol alpha-3-L-rhamnosyltransferase [Flavobacterium magnum]|uniref:dTDP-Rha--alpha-D-GlcNAc-pyrophosphate polyprenol alpha-3-L-rhamnosyltransferase n=1 Tax=Flavobacterium magnum TaxID=2162713 RepID=A0A2S0REB3_9FLAO|nr:glycosyltransferase family 2 protein [Flavobacterium magnum]AWA30287.1 dTDP-Rha--alpha-D-GlcNAc-pyrophosphate polyprenol alpha-3-L-rhamnosyltransferase [Flavobacterium magnum]
MTVAVVILNWNGKSLLEQFLPSVVRYSPEAVVYVADNASTDDSLDFVKTYYPSVKIIRNTGNFGFAKGYNEALRFVDEDIYALVNSDIEVTENWLQPILSTFETEKNVAAIQPKIRDYKDKQYFEYAGAGGGFIDKFGYPFCRGRIFDTIETDHGQYDDAKDIFWASGACLFIRKAVYRQLGGFDDSFFAHQEEIDLCWRIFNKGLTIRYIPESTVYHVGGATLQQGNPRKTFLNFRNSLLMLTKNLPRPSLYSVLFQRLLLDAVAAFQFLSKGKLRHFLAIIEAHFSFYGRFGTTLQKREKHQKRDYYAVKSIVKAYYISGKKTFHNLF